MACFKNFFRLSLLFAVVILISSKASARNEPGVSQTQGGKQVDDWHGGGGGWHGGGGGWHGGGGGGWHGGGGGGGWHGGGGGGGWHGGGGGGWHGCHYPHCKDGAGGDETHQAEKETNSGDKHMP